MIFIAGIMHERDALQQPQQQKQPQWLLSNGKRQTVHPNKRRLHVSGCRRAERSAEVLSAQSVAAVSRQAPAVSWAKTLGTW